MFYFVTELYPLCASSMQQCRVLALTVLVAVVCACASGQSTTGGGGECTASGRFPDPDAAACRGFLMCIARADGSFARYNLTCPLDFVFNPVDGVCTDAAAYRCPSDDVHLYDCTVTGHFENPNATDCRTFVLCSPYIGGVLIPRVLTCPEGHVFEPFEANCVNETQYTCGDHHGPMRASTMTSAAAILHLSMFTLVGSIFLTLLIHI